MSERALAMPEYIEESQIHMQDLIKVIMRRRWIIVTFFTICVITTLVGSLRQKPVYQGTVTLKIERQSPNVVSYKEVAPVGMSDYQMYREYYETQYKLMKSRAVLGGVMESLGIHRLYASRNKKGDPIERFSRTIKINPVRNSQLVEINAESTDPQMAAQVANTVAAEYMRQNLERTVSTTNEAYLWLSKKIAEQKQKVMESELALQRYRLQHDIRVLPQINGEKADEDIKSEYAKLQALLDNYSQRYTDEHPKMVEMRAQISSLRNKIQGLEDGDIGNKTMEYMVLERDMQTNKQMHDGLVARQKEISLTGSLTASNIVIIDKAEPPLRPIRPRVKLNLLLALVFGLFGGTGIAFFIDYLDATIRTPEDVRTILESHFLGAIPNIEGDNEIAKDTIMHLEQSSPTAEAYRNVRTDILSRISKVTQGAKALLVTAAEPMAGKTTTVSNLGIALASQGYSVLIVDCDLRKPQLHKIFGVERDYGVTDYLLDGISFESVIKPTEIRNLRVMTSGRTVKNPVEILGYPKLQMLIQEVKNKFDYIVVDSPPFTSLADSVILADRLDATVQVVRSGKTLVPVAKRAKELLTHTKSILLGVILNDLPVYNDDYYSYRYYHYYNGDGKRRPSEDKQKKWETGDRLNELCRKTFEVWKSMQSDAQNLNTLIKSRKRGEADRERREKEEIRA